MSIDGDSFEVFFEDAEPKIRVALSAAYGARAGREAAVDALSYGWEHWDRVRSMDNPVGYLYAVGRDRARRSRGRRRNIALDPVGSRATPWIEPELPDALAKLPERQRIVVMLLHCFDWTMTEVADVLDVSKSTVQTHAERGLERLRSQMGVTL